MMDVNYLNKRGLLYKNQSLYMEDIDLNALAQNKSTPIYVYSYKALIKQINLLKKTFNNPSYSIHYAVKANPHKAILSLIGMSGLGTDIVSSGELYRCLQCSINSQAIVFSGVGKTEQDIEYALNNNIKQINIESYSEYQCIDCISKKLSIQAPVSIRINPDISAGFHKKVSTGKEGGKFGVPFHEALEIYNHIKQNKNMIFRGFSYHIGSDIKDISAFTKALNTISSFLIKEAIYPVSCIDIGGGMSIPYQIQDEDFNLKQYEKEISKILLQPRITREVVIEPGRFCIGMAGVILTKIVAIKNKKGPNPMIIIDAGMHNLIRPALYNSYHNIIPCSVQELSQKKYSIHGPICETSDIFHKKINIKRDVKIKDCLCILDTGAYGATMASTYNSHPLCAEYMISDNKIKEITPPFNTEFFFKKEKCFFEG